MMLGKALILLCSAAILVSAANDAATEVQHNPSSGASSTLKIQPTTSPAPSNDTTTKPPPVTTTKPITTPTTTVKTTSAPITTPKPMPPTTPSTTTTPKPSTTTPKPSTTTIVPTTIEPPTPVPIPTTKKWSVNGTNETCIVVQMAAQFEITYHLNKTEKVTRKMNLPVDKVVVSGDCNSTEQAIVFSWNSTKGIKNDSFTLHFLKNDTTKKYSLHHMELTIEPQDLPKYNSTSNETLKFVHMTDEYPTGLGNSYRCVKEKSFKLMEQGSNETEAIVKLNDVQFQAFKSDKNTSFGLAEDCAFDTPDMVPIAVGCALAALVVIVLVAYLIGRRRAQARGYLSM